MIPPHELTRLLRSNFLLWDPKSSSQDPGYYSGTHPLLHNAPIHFCVAISAAVHQNWRVGVVLNSFPFVFVLWEREIVQNLLSLTSPRCGSTFGHHLKTSDRIEHSNVLRWWDSVWKSNLINQFWCLAFEIGFTRPAHLKERLSNGFECAWNSTALYLDTVELHACSNTIRCRSSRWAGLVKPVLNNFDL